MFCFLQGVLGCVIFAFNRCKIIHINHAALAMQDIMAAFRSASENEMKGVSDL
jgi:hypothetical protein